jgi:hypothetical protein
LSTGKLSPGIAYVKKHAIPPDPPPRCHLPFDKLTVLSTSALLGVEGLTVPSTSALLGVEGLTVLSTSALLGVERLTALRILEGLFESASIIFRLSQRSRHLIEA